MKILILSVDPWLKSNSFGNTYSNIFGKIANIEIAHVYLLDSLPNKENNVSRYYQISESKIIKSALRPFGNDKGVGYEVFLADEHRRRIPNSNNAPIRKSVYRRLLDFGKKHHWKTMFLAREMAWKLGKVNYEGLYKFIDDFQPELFVLAYYNVYNCNQIASRIKQQFNIPMVMIMMMDHYSLKRVSWNPIFWADRFAKRAIIRKLVKQSEMLFVISKMLKDEMERDLHIPCRVLYKIPDENRAFYPYKMHESSLRFLFTGNIYANRWKSLAMLVKELKEQKIGRLDIYTATPISPSMNKALHVEGVSEIHAPVSQDEVIKLQNGADVLVHTEAFDKFNKYLVRCAISTKIMDYLSVGRCILAIGPDDISSIEYLKDNDLALIASSESELHDVIHQIQKKREIVAQYAEKSFTYSQKQLNPKEIRQKLYDDLQQIIDNYSRLTT